MTDNEALRNTILQEADGIGTRRRFGLFSQPVPVAVGDDGQYKTKLRTIILSQTLAINPENLLLNSEECTLTLLVLDK